jgi:hypothetical protein
MRTALAILIALARIAHADTFEAHAQGAQRVRAEDLVWTLTATCSDGDDTHQRQCRHARDARRAELGRSVLLIDGDAEAFDVGAWNASTKTVPLTVSACIRCYGALVDGKPWYVVGSGVATTLRGDVFTTAPLRSVAVAFPTETDAAAWSRAVGNARLELVVKVPAHPQWSHDGKDGLALEIVAWRVVAPCDGMIVVASPPSTPVPPDKTQCIAAPRGEPAHVDAELTVDMVHAGLQPVVEAARVCYSRFAVAGSATLALKILPDGTIGRYEQLGDFVDTPTGACIDKAVAKLTFPPSAHGLSLRLPLAVAP